MWAVIGLGNPGRRYAGTRHNVGCSLIRTLAREWKARPRKKKFSATVAETQRNGKKLILVEPRTYMNESGGAVKQILEGMKIGPADIVVVYDDLDIPLGQIRVRKEGSAGTHKGMKSIIREIGTPAFPRIRIGIGPLADREEAARFVLAPFAKDEMVALKNGQAKAREALELILDGSIVEAMNLFNQKETRQGGTKRGKIESR